MSEALDDARADPGRIIADLRGQLAVRTAERDQARAERDAAVEQQTDRRGLAGHQLLARRPRAGIRRDIGQGA